jgi:3-isopropylmalate/(R)-2-methylmalate dehydratase small subunit
MVPFTSVTGIAAPLIRDDINTDEITPIQIARTLRPDYAEILFMRARRRADGSPDPTSSSTGRSSCGPRSW